MGLKKILNREWSIDLCCYKYLNVVPYLLEVIPIFLEPSVDRGDPSLAATVIVTYKVFAVFVYGVVGEVHAHFSL